MSLFRFGLCHRAQFSRFCEFGRAVAEIRLADPASPLRYLGFVKTKDSGEPSAFKDLVNSVRSKVWEHWDSSTMAPPKTRPREDAAAAAPSLQLLAFQDGRPVFPEVLRSRFPVGTAEHAEVETMFEKFKEKFPQQPRPSAQPQGSAPRSGGLCDFSVNQGKMPVDPNRQVDLVPVKDADFQVRRTSVGQLKHVMIRFYYVENIIYSSRFPN